MNQIGICYSYWCRDWAMDFSKYVPEVSRMGFDVFEISSNILSGMSVIAQNKLKDAAKSESIELAFVMSLREGCDIASPDSQQRKNGMKVLRENISTIHQMGGSGLSGVILGQWGVGLTDENNDKRPSIDRSVSCMKEVIKLAEDSGITCNIEVVNRYEQYLVNTAQEALEYVEMVGSPNIKIHLDTYHMNIEEDSFKDAILLAGDKLGHFHLGENNRRLPGSGHIPWVEVFQALKAINYSKYIVMEPFINHEGDVARSVKLWRDIKGSHDYSAAGKTALQFIKKIMNEVA